jgi:hypothetical protein
MDPTQPESQQPPQPPSGQEGPASLSNAPGVGAPGVRWVLVRAAALGFLIIIAFVALVWLASIPLMSVGHSPVNEGSAPPDSIPQNQPVTSPTATQPVLPSATIEQLPRNSEVYVTIQPKDLAGRVTIRFDGGPGKSMVKDIEGRLTRPDGSIDSASMDLLAEFPEVILQGSKGTDQIEVFVRLLSGKTYRVIDEMVPYRQRL